MDKETQNIIEIKRYLGSIATVSNISKVLTVFYADIKYEDDELKDICIKNTELRFQHSYNNELTIPALDLPYYNSFWPSHQDFIFEDGHLVIHGKHHDNPRLSYKITVK